MRDDHRGQCLYCGLEIPSVSDFCSISCEAYFSCLGSEDLHEEPKNNIDAYGIFTVDLWASGNFTIDTIRNMDEKEGAFKSLAIMSLGAAGETGEVIEHVKKFLRDGNLDLEALKLELGDMVYYWARLCKFFNLEPSEVIAANVRKLESRKARGTIRGSGDNR